VPRGGVIVGRHDGSCLYYTLSNNKRVVLTGADVDPIYGIALTEEYVFTGARDGKIRKYQLDEIIP